LVTVDNVAPAASVTGPAGGVRGQSRTFTLGASDPSPVDQAADFTYIIDWGDGTKAERVAGPSGTQVEHVFTQEARDKSGAIIHYVVQVTATDKDRGTSAAATLDVTISVVAHQDDPLFPDRPDLKMLVVGGTLRGDTIAFGRKTSKATDEIEVSID